MKLLIKPISKEIDSYIKKGNDSFLFGLKGFTAFSSCDLTLKELKNLQLKYPNINLFVLLDKNIFEKDLNKLLEALKELATLKLSGLFFYDLAVLNMTLDNQLDLPLIWNQNFLVTNYRTCNYYKKEGVKGAVISSEITIDEIVNISRNIDMDLFVNIFGFQLMAVSKRLLLSSYFDYVNESNEDIYHYMSEKTGRYGVIENDYGTKFISKDIFNGIRYINRLKDAGIKYIILDDYGIDKDIFDNVLECFNLAINSSTDDELLELERKINCLIPTSLGFLDKKTIYKVK